MSEVLARELYFFSARDLNTLRLCLLLRSDNPSFATYHYGTYTDSFLYSFPPSSPRLLRVQWLQKLVHSDKLHFAGFSLSFAEDLQAPGTLFSFSVRRTADTYIVHSAARDDHSLFFLGSTCPREWVVWDVPNMKGDWEELQLKWASSEKTFKIKGHDNQYVRWEKSGGGDGSGVFKATSSPSKATDFVLREAGG